MTIDAREGLVAHLGLAAVGERVVRPKHRESSRLCVETFVETRTPWWPRGGGGGDKEGDRTATKPLAPSDPDRWCLDMRGLDSILDYWPDDLVCRVGAGITFDNLQTTLARRGLRLRGSSLRPRDTTLGGAYARGDAGLRGAPGDSLRDQVLGLVAVAGGGEVVKAGARVVKNVAGYDLARLFHGSHGAFGVVLDFVLRLEAIPGASHCVALPTNFDAALDLLSKWRRPARSFDPAVQLWLNATASRALGGPEQGALFLMAEGWPESIDAWREATARAQGVTLANEAAQAWNAVRDLDANHALWIQLPASRLVRWWGDNQGWISGRGSQPNLVADLLAGSARLWSTPSPFDGELVAEVARTVREAGGWVWSPTAASSPSPALIRLKRALDPHGLLPPIPTPVLGPTDG